MTCASRRTAIALVAIAVALMLLIAPARPAAAHSTLVQTDPPASSHLDASPKVISLRFNEVVAGPVGAIRVFDVNGKRLDDGSVSRVGDDDHTVSTDLARLPDGGYVVTWRVISADGHPAQGAFTFSVGIGRAVSDNVAARLLAARGGAVATGGVFAAARFLALSGTLVLLGIAFLIVTAWQAGRTTGRTARIVWISWLVALVATVASFVLEGVYGAGLPLSDVARSTVLSSTFHTRYGEAALGRVALLVIGGAPLIRPLLASSVPRWWRPLAGVWALVLLAALSYGGHASTGLLPPVAMIADVAHVGAAAAWIGGLVGLVLLVLPATSGAERAHALRSVSKANLIAVAVLITSGLIQSWRQVGTLGAIGRTDYGHLLAAKTIAVALMIGLGALARSMIRTRWPANAVTPTGAAGEPTPPNNAPQPTRRTAEPNATARLLKSVRAEVVLATAVLVLTALLVEAQPARTADARPFNVTFTSNLALVDLSIDPAKVGRTDVHAYLLTPAGAQLDAQDVEIELRNDAKGIGPLNLNMRRITPGHWASYATTLPLAGRWQIDTKVRTTDIDEHSWNTTMIVRG